MNPYDIRKHADEFGISYKSAVYMRIRYLVDQACQCVDWMEGRGEWPDVYYGEAIDQIHKLKMSMKVSKHETITDQMIERARAVPCKDILEFGRGWKTYAWCHDDKNPSLVWMQKVNKAWCPPCNKWFDAIAIQQHFTGQSFTEAVRELCRR